MVLTRPYNVGMRVFVGSCLYLLAAVVGLVCVAESGWLLVWATARVIAHPNGWAVIPQVCVALPLIALLTQSFTALLCVPLFWLARRAIGSPLDLPFLNVLVGRSPPPTLPF